MLSQDLKKAYDSQEEEKMPDSFINLDSKYFWPRKSKWNFLFSHLFYRNHVIYILNFEPIFLTKH